MNEQKKSRIYSEGNRTVIELDLSFDRAWSTVSRAIEASDIVSTDRNREEGIFYVSLEPQLEESRLNFLNPFNLFRKEHSSDINLRMMHGINKISFLSY